MKGKVLCVTFIVFAAVLTGFARAQDDVWISSTTLAYVSALADDGDYIWVGSEWGLTRLHRATGDISFYHERLGAGLPSEQISALAIDPQGNTWIGTDGGGLTKFDGTNWTVYNADSSQLPNNTINSIAIDNEGNVWIGTEGGGAVLYDGTTWKVYDTDTSQLPKNIVTSLSIDPEGTVWIGTEGGGAASYDGNTWTVYNIGNSGLPNNIIHALAVDNVGAVWFGTNWGLAKFDGENWMKFTSFDSGLPNNTVKCLSTDDQGNVWIGTKSGLARFDGENWTVYYTDNSGLSNNEILTLAADTDGSIWAGTPDGLAQFDGTAWKEWETGILAGRDAWSLSGRFYFEGYKRNYIVFLPHSYNSTSNMPVVINLHGATLTAQRQMDYVGMNAVADTAGFIAVYPTGMNKDWYWWYEGYYTYPDGVYYDDVGFIDALIDTLNSNYSIDLKRIYSCGYSAGGYMSFKLACQLSERIAAIASVAAPMPEWLSKDCNAQRAMPVLLINGTADPNYTGKEGVRLSVEQTLDFWVNFNSCTESDTILLPDLDPSDGCTVEKITYTKGIANSSVVFYKVINGGHLWPGAVVDVPQYGHTNRDINANVEIWNFFKNYELSESTGVTSHSNIPIGFSLFQNYPNPFNPSTTLSYHLKSQSNVELSIYDLTGQKVETLVSQKQPAGYYELEWDASTHASGMYFYCLSAGDFVQIKKLILLK